MTADEVGSGMRSPTGKLKAREDRGVSTGFIGLEGETEIEKATASIFEADVATAAYQASLEAEAEAIFAKMVDFFGDNKARDLWTAIAKQPKGRPPGPKDEKIEAFLLSLWDEYRRDHPTASRHGAAKAVATHLHETLSQKVWERIGADVNSVAKRIVKAAGQDGKSGVQNKHPILK